MNVNYIKFVKGLDDMSEALIAIGKSEDSKPIKLLVSRLVEKLGFNNAAIGDDIAMIRFAVANDDESLEKLTIQVTKGYKPEPVKSPSEGAASAKPLGEEVAQGIVPLEK